MQPGMEEHLTDGRSETLDWRASERAIFRLLDGVVRGDLPCSGTSSDELRRLGYLSEFAALRLRALHRDILLRWASELREQVERRARPARPSRPLWTRLASSPSGTRWPA